MISLPGPKLKLMPRGSNTDSPSPHDFAPAAPLIGSRNRDHDDGKLPTIVGKFVSPIRKATIWGGNPCVLWNTCGFSEQAQHFYRTVSDWGKITQGEVENPSRHELQSIILMKPQLMCNCVNIGHMVGKGQLSEASPVYTQHN